METRLLILNADPVFQDRALAILDEIDDIETRVVRTMPEAVSVLLAENFDGFVVEGENPTAMAQATSARQHFPSLRIVCLAPKTDDAESAVGAQQQKIAIILSDGSERSLRKPRSLTPLTILVIFCCCAVALQPVSFLFGARHAIFSDGKCWRALVAWSMATGFSPSTTKPSKFSASNTETASGMVRTTRVSMSSISSRMARARS